MARSSGLGLTRGHSPLCSCRAPPPVLLLQALILYPVLQCVGLGIFLVPWFFYRYYCTIRR